MEFGSMLMIFFSSVPVRMGLQAMMNICQRFASCHNLKFSPHSDPVKSKTKCIHFYKKKIDLAKIELNGNSLPWVDSAHHVGNILERDNSFSKDIRMKRGSFIGRVHSIFQEFHFANPVVKMKMISLYTSPELVIDTLLKKSVNICILWSCWHQGF